MKRLISFFTKLCENYLPDAFVFCLILTLLVFALSLGFTPHSAPDLIGFWGREFWSLNSFAMQMVFVLISGHMVATTPFIKKLLRHLTQVVSTETQGLLLLSFFSCLACWLNWGFGLIVSGILAVELSRKLRKVNFGLFVATAYSGFLVWHAGLSGSIPLKIASSDEILGKVYPGLVIPLSETIFSRWNITACLLLLTAVSVVALLMRTDEKVSLPPLEDKPMADEERKDLRDALETTPFLHWIFFLIFAVFLIQSLRGGESLDLNKVNLIFLFLALLLHETPRRFLTSLQESVGFSSGIIIQFPFYAGIMGLMQHSGLGDVISEVFVRFSTAKTLPLFTFWSGGIVNFFIPSGGGQWAVQGPLMLKAAKDLGVNPAKVSMALAWGDAWTNMIQPFWTLPLLSLARLELKDIMGYCLIYLTVSGAVLTGVFLWI
jgi:short-chain fatty acids transporter